MVDAAPEGFRNRVKELRMVPANQLHPNPKNWRQHGDVQRSGLDAVLAEIGFAGAVLVREDEEGELHLTDGHLRTEQAGDQEIPVLVTDLTEEEAEQLLAVYDPIAGMAETDSAALTGLLEGVGHLAVSEGMTALLEDVREVTGLGGAVLDEQKTDAKHVDDDPYDGNKTRSPTDQVVVWPIHVPVGMKRLIKQYRKEAVAQGLESPDELAVKVLAAAAASFGGKPAPDQE